VAARICHNVDGGEAMKARSLKNTSSHLATRCVLSALAVVAVISIGNVESAHAFNLGGSFRPSMPRITPRITPPRISVGSGSVAAAANAAGYSHGPKPGISGAAAGAAGYGGNTAGPAGGGNWGHKKWVHEDHTYKPEHVVEHVTKCGTRYHKDHLERERGCDISPPKHVVVNGGNVGPSNIAPSNTGPSNPGPSLVGPGRSGGSGVPAADERRYVPNEIVGELSGNPSDQTFRTIETRHRLNRIDTQRIGLTNSTFVRWRIADRRTVPAVLRAMEADNTVRTAGLVTQPNYLFVTQQGAAGEADNAVAVEPPQTVVEPPQTATPSSEAAPAAQAGDAAQYALAKLHLPEAQALARGDSVVVAVIDTEIDVTHPELAGAITDSYDALGVAGPKETHGTGIAGTIAARARLLGVAPNVRILAIRAFGSGIGTTFSIIKALDYAVAHDARVINMSFAGPSDPALARALAAAHAKGRILIAAVGNKGPKSPALFPAADPNVIAVTATDAKDRLFEGANRGDHVAIAAPGVDILVAAPGNTYAMSTGTSFASAYVAGVAALLAERKPDITPDAAKNALMSTAHHLGAKARDAQFGAGLMDAHQAILSVGGKPAAELARDAGH
jgi:hypothetical protein